MTTHRLFVPGHPAPQGSKRHVGRGILVESSKRVAPWRAVVALALGQAIATPLAGAISLDVEFVMPRPKSTPKRRTPHAIKRPDLDKLLRALLDAGTKTAWCDDSQIVHITSAKRLAELDEQPGARIIITEIGDPA
ncbi:RusA family crossover junction endodeoxyribonuclease [Gordonia sp. PP30]|uniref:RusA family crossover junction endodeoxyribonuclease n=1 Tax=Gordonia sp. PP30 TaxID=2935861 RepID=UPI001FFEAA10|nr:RusA family crossover junction endodeoxyribonuclease [Gordonia sp. PP30]UQE73853.1 RusA family crossover junction endodeoxyribonuclease [Gordonia sp. PP30]